jgi:hypothetical protein
MERIEKRQLLSLDEPYYILLEDLTEDPEKAKDRMRFLFE